ncbi:MAG: DUF1444 family protein [Rhodobacteraceae bacterium]|nr:DUF1444 family protein [Paracoccaceae bacterium]
MKSGIILFLTFLTLTTPVTAQISRPETLLDTLTILAQAYRSAPEIQDVTVNRAEISLGFTLANGTAMTSFPDNLHSLLRAAESDGERQDILNGFIGNLLAGFASANAPIDPRNIFPIIRAEGYGAGLGEGQQPYSEPFAKGLRIFFAEDLPTTIRYIDSDQARAFPSPDHLIFTRALGNFLRQAIPFEIQGSGPYMLVADGNYEASFLLDTALWQEISEQLNEVILIVPARDLVIFADGTLPNSRDTLARLLALDEAAYPLGGEILVWASDHWEVD